MPIKRRLSGKLKKLAYHRLIGDVETIPKNLPKDKAYALETVRPDFCTRYTMKQSRFPQEFWDVPRTKVICGTVYNRGHGIGPGEGSVAWFCSNLAHDKFQYMKPTGFTSRQVSRISIKPVFLFIGVFQPKDHGGPHGAYEAAVRAVWEAYEDHHGVNLFVTE